MIVLVHVSNVHSPQNFTDIWSLFLGEPDAAPALLGSLQCPRT